MPISAPLTQDFTRPVSPPPEEAEAPGIGDTFSAAFRMENDVVNLWDLMTREKEDLTDDPSFQLAARLKTDGMWDDYRYDFLGIRNENEYMTRLNRVKQEIEDRDTLTRAGWGGVAAGMTAGILSPTIFLPFTGQARGVVAVGRGAAMAAAGAALQEIPLAAAQETRTPGEIGFSIAASTVIGGVLGGAASMLRPRELEELAERAYISPRETSASSLGAAGAMAPDAGRLKTGVRTLAGGLDSNPVTRSPVTDALESDYTTARWTMSQLSDGGLTMEKNALGIPTTPGGTAESRIAYWFGQEQQFFTKLYDNYADYIFDSGGPQMARNLRARYEGWKNPSKMDRATFNKEVSIAASREDIHPDPFVHKSAQEWRKLQKEIQENLESVGLLRKELKLLADPSYISHLWKHDLIQKDPEKFVDFIAERFNKRLQAEFSTKLEKFEARQQEALTEEEDILRPQDQVDLLTKKFREELEQLEDITTDLGFDPMLEQVAALRSQATKAATRQERRQLLRDATDMEKAAGEQYAEIKSLRNATKRRLRNLSKSEVMLERRQAAKLDKVERAEELTLNALRRAAKKGQQVLNKLDEFSDKELDRELSELRSAFAKAGEQFDAGEERILKLAETPEDEKLLALDDLQTRRAEKMSDLAEQIDAAADTGVRTVIRSSLRAILDETLERSQGIIERRAVRTARLREQAMALDPARAAKRVTELQEARALRLADFEGRIRVQDDNFVVGGKADFTKYAREAAYEVKDKILGTYIRLPVVDIMQDERGAVLARTLDIPFADAQDWLETDIEEITRKLIYTMGPDIEIARKFGGEVNAASKFKELGDEMNQKTAEIKADPKYAENGTLNAKGEKETLRVQNEFARQKKNLEAVVGRLRHMRGLPNDPNGMAYRMQKVMMDLNTLRYMGMVSLSSVPDVAAPVLKYGLTRVMRQGFLPMLNGMKELKIGKREAQLAGAAIEALTSQRARTMFDLAEDIGRTSRFERGLQYASGKQGIVALFSYWTDSMKFLTSAVSISKITDSIGDVVEKGGSAKAREFLAANGIDEGMARRIMDEMSTGEGGGKVNGVWYPNTEAWKDKEAVRAFRAALAREVNRTIITPGAERPGWIDASPFMRLISQFRSFGLSSTYRTLAAGMQQRDAALVSGITASLALGALSYYLSAITRGGESYERMTKAEPGQWADEAIQRSGLLAIFGMGQDMLSRVPATAPYVSLSGKRSTRRGGDDILETILGPSFDAAKLGLQVTTGLDDPTRSTVHAARQLMPWQNTILLSRAWDSIEAAIPVKERR